VSAKIEAPQFPLFMVHFSSGIAGESQFLQCQMANVIWAIENIIVSEYSPDCFSQGKEQDKL
jgi:hypothetical protein